MKDRKDAPIIYVINFVVILAVLFILFFGAKTNELQQVNEHLSHIDITLEQILNELRNNSLR